MAMKRERSVAANGEAIENYRRTLGVTTSELAQQAGVSKDTVRRALRSERVFEKTMAKIARALDKPLSSVLIESCDQGLRLAGGIRDASGRWQITGEDIVVPGHFEYAIPPKRFTAEIDIIQTAKDGRVEIVAAGRDQDNDIVNFDGELTENGNYIFGRYSIKNDRMHVYGNVFVEYLGDGKTMKGHYLGRDTGHDSGTILGSLTLYWIGQTIHADPTTL
jgi:transcriptional regulator with XRE-family HTH domain